MAKNSPSSTTTSIEIQKESPFLKKPKLINGVLSYSKSLIKINGEKFFVSELPEESFYKDGAYICRLVKYNSGMWYDDIPQVYQWLYKNGNFEKTDHFYESKKPIVNIWSKKNNIRMYNKDLNIKKFDWQPDWYYVFSINDWVCKLTNNVDEKNNKQNLNEIYMLIDDNYKLSNPKWLPEWYFCKSEFSSWFVNIENWKNYTYFMYDENKKEVFPVIWMLDDKRLHLINKKHSVCTIWWELYFYDQKSVKKIEFDFTDSISWADSMKSDIDASYAYSYTDYENLNILKISNQKSIKLRNSKLFNRIWNSNKLKEIDTSKVINKDFVSADIWVINSNILYIDYWFNRTFFYRYKDNKLVPINVSWFKKEWTPCLVHNNKCNLPVLDFPIFLAYVNSSWVAKHIKNVPNWMRPVTLVQNTKNNPIVRLLSEDYNREINALLSKDWSMIMIYKDEKIGDMIISDFDISTKTIKYTNRFFQEINKNLNDDEWAKFITEYDPSYKVTEDSKKSIKNRIVDDLTNALESK